MELSASVMSNTFSGNGGSGESGLYDSPYSSITDHSEGYADVGGQIVDEVTERTENTRPRQYAADVAGQIVDEVTERTENTRPRQYACGCKRRIVISIVVGFLLVLAIAAGVIYHVTSSTEEDICRPSPNTVVCPYTEEYSRVHIWSPRKKFENGDGPVTFDLKHDTDTIVEGYNIQVKNNLIIIRKEPPECADEEDQPITFTKENNTKVDETRLSLKVKDSTLSKFSLEKGKNETIKWNVHVKDPLDVHQLQTELNGIFRPNRSSLNGRFHFDVSVVENIATCEVRLTPTSCVDNGKWMLHFQNGDTLDKQFQVDGIPNLTACPEHLTVPLKDNENGKLELQFISCIPDAVETYSVDIYGRINKSGLPRTDAVIDIPDQKGINFQASTDLNELLVTLTMGKLTCDDHEKKFNMILVSKTGAALQHFTSIASIVGRYGNSSTGGDFIENMEAVVNLRIHLGCRPQNYKIFINGSHEISPAKLIEDVYTGEKMFSQTFSYPQTSMADDRTTLSLESSFIDDEGKRNTVSAKQEIRIVPETFCEEKNQGCNYQHPYNANKMIACGDKVIAAFRSCQDGLVFVKSSSCVGLCCPEGFTDNCQRP